MTRRKNTVQATEAKNDHQDHLWCECGNPKTKRSIACERCAFLDGSTASRVIPALRDLGHADVYQIASHAGSGVRNVHIALRRLERAGRVKRTLVAGVADYKLISC